ncbi:hypothetical protein MMC28_004338 [Mycoblastus sanguinarius]|nr:hypothetical protein [Mycoblastus sanguinarius]
MVRVLVVRDTLHPSKSFLHIPNPSTTSTYQNRFKQADENREHPFIHLLQPSLKTASDKFDTRREASRHGYWYSLLFNQYVYVRAASQDPSSLQPPGDLVCTKTKPFNKVAKVDRIYDHRSQEFTTL